MTDTNSVNNLIYFLPLLWGLVLRSSTSLFPYSGMSKAPMFGDFEAQRHWMEITFNLKPKEWYRNGTNNDLSYWGIDYPPLTAYHSYILGAITNKVDSSLIKLNVSHGIESDLLKCLMRSFSLVTEVICYLSVLCIYYFKIYPQIFSKKLELFSVLCGFLYPGIILIDHGHFQYNSASLGLYFISCLFLMKNYDVCGSIFFCFALSYKQMELYHALPIFFLLLAKSMYLMSFRYLMKISMTVILTFLLVMIPLFISDQTFQPIIDVLLRLFPVSRGLYEDKVSNFWCAISPIFKFTSQNQALVCCGSLTLLTSLPACINLSLNIRCKQKFLISSFLVSLNFFLFSYHVHEKSILIPAVSAILLGALQPLWCNSFLYFSVISMAPLLIKDGLLIAMISLVSIFLLCFIPILKLSSKWFKLMFGVFNLGYLIILLAALFIPPPLRYPFLYPLFLSQWSCFIFLVHGAYFYYGLFSF